MATRIRDQNRSELHCSSIMFKLNIRFFRGYISHESTHTELYIVVVRIYLRGKELQCAFRTQYFRRHVCFIICSDTVVYTIHTICMMLHI